MSEDRMTRVALPMLTAVELDVLADALTVLDGMAEKVLARAGVTGADAAAYIAVARSLATAVTEAREGLAAEKPDEVWTEAEVAEVRTRAAELHQRLFEKQTAEKPGFRQVTWHDVDPADAVGLTLPHKGMEGPLNELGERCPWPWDPQQLKGAPMGQYHCPYCGGMQLAGVPHIDWTDVPDEPDSVK